MNKNVDAVNHREFQQFFHDTRFDTLREMKMKEGKKKGVKKEKKKKEKRIYFVRSGTELVA